MPGPAAIHRLCLVDVQAPHSGLSRALGSAALRALASAAAYAPTHAAPRAPRPLVSQKPGPAEPSDPHCVDSRRSRSVCGCTRRTASSPRSSSARSSYSPSESRHSARSTHHQLLNQAARIRSPRHPKRLGARRHRQPTDPNQPRPRPPPHDRPRSLRRLRIRRPRRRPHQQPNRRCGRQLVCRRLLRVLRHRRVRHGPQLLHHQNPRPRQQR